MKTFDTHIISREYAGMTVQEYIAKILQYSGRRIQKLTRAKGILVNNKTVYLQKKIKENDHLRILILEENTSKILPEKGPIHILYEDENIIVANKPAHQLVHPAGETMGGTLANYLAYYLREKQIKCSIHAVHRLDRDTSGCVLFAKNARTQTILEDQLKNRTLKRTYLALVEGGVHPSTGVITASIGKHPTHPNRRAIREEGESAITHYRTLDVFSHHTLLELFLDTGRTHQIRIHLAHIGHPIIGDGMYGIRSPWIKRQALHAAAVTFIPIEKAEPLTIQAPLPDDFSNAIAQCKK